MFSFDFEWKNILAFDFLVVVFWFPGIEKFVSDVSRLSEHPYFSIFYWTMISKDARKLLVVVCLYKLRHRL